MSAHSTLIKNVSLEGDFFHPCYLEFPSVFFFSEEVLVAMGDRI